MAEFLPIVSGKDPRDGVSCAQPDLELKGGKITSVAVPEDISAAVSKDVLSAFETSLDILKSMGIEVKEVKMPFLKYALPAHSIITASETSTGLAKYVGMRYGQQDGDLSLKFDDYFTSFRTEYFGEDTKKKILLGTYVRMSKLRDRYYVKARKVRTHVVASYKKVLEDHDAILTPSVPFVSPRFDDIPKMSSDDVYSADIFSCPPNLAGMPHLSVPCGYSDNGMPIGMQLVTGHWCEDPLVTFAKDWDSAFTVKRPEVSL
jgi:aspartyl-tRNA(Asn)/glutamyl-tRNA(Gln) amidotransferase subunit A